MRIVGFSCYRQNEIYDPSQIAGSDCAIGFQGRIGRDLKRLIGFLTHRVCTSKALHCAHTPHKH